MGAGLEKAVALGKLTATAAWAISSATNIVASSVSAAVFHQEDFGQALVRNTVTFGITSVIGWGVGSAVRGAARWWNGPAEEVEAGVARAAEADASNLMHVRDELPELGEDDFKSFEEFSNKVYEPGDRIVRSPNDFAEPVDKPGGFFGTEDTHSMGEFEKAYNVTKYDNPISEVRVYEFNEPVTVYEGPVAGGTGTQVLIPRDINPSSVLTYIGSHPLYPPG